MGKDCPRRRGTYALTDSSSALRPTNGTAAGARTTLLLFCDIAPNTIESLIREVIAVRTHSTPS